MRHETTSKPTESIGVDFVQNWIDTGQDWRTMGNGRELTVINASVEVILDRKTDTMSRVLDGS